MLCGPVTMIIVSKNVMLNWLKSQLWVTAALCDKNGKKCIFYSVTIRSNTTATVNPSSQFTGLVAFNTDKCTCIKQKIRDYAWPVNYIKLWFLHRINNESFR